MAVVRVNPVRFARLRLLLATSFCALVTAANPALSQTLNERLAQRSSEAKTDRLLVDAREIVYDNNTERVEARGDVQLYYQNRTLQADRVIYDRKTKRVYAEGNAKLIDVNGQIIYSERFELTDDFRDGFIDSLRVVSPDRQRITAARGERTDGETTVFERGTYTSCEPCRDNPEKPPLWQVKAARIIAKNSEQMIYYEDARLEFFGLPVGYIPYFSTPDPTVNRKSGVLTPRYSRRGTTGYSFSLPIYFALAPHYDVLWTPTAMSRQGFHNEVEWRHRLETGVYNIRASGIFQEDSGAFLPGPLGPNRARFGNVVPFTGGLADIDKAGVDNRNFRGSLETSGKFLINPRWTFGWDVTLQTDKFYINNYRLRSQTTSAIYFRESVSSIYLRGKSEKSYFDLSNYYFQGHTSSDWQKQSPVVHPVLDFNRRFNIAGIGGEFSFDFNATSLSRELPDFFGIPTGAQRFGSTRQAPNPWLAPPPLFAYQFGGTSYWLYYGCQRYNRGQCLLRGIGGVSNRATATLGWRQRFIDPIGQVWTPFVSTQVSVFNHTLNTTNASAFPGALAATNAFGSEKQLNFLSDSTTTTRAMPAVGLEYRYPLVAATGGMSHLFEPIAQIVVRPNEQGIGRSPNEDSQSLVFSDANLFSLNRFSGYDRTEGGTRAAVALQYTGRFSTGGHINALIGQSYHLAGRNSYKPHQWGTTDLMNTGLNSGLDRVRSDYVGRFSIVPNDTFSLTARGRFDESSLKLKRLDVTGSMTVGSLTTSLNYTRQDPQPDLGFVRRREGASVISSFNLPNNWFVNGSVTVDLDRYLYDRDRVLTQAPGNVTLFTYKNTPFRPAAYSVGFGYADECTIFSVNYSRTTSDLVGAKKTTTTSLLFRLELKHLGEVNYRQGQTAADTTTGGR